MAGNPTFKKRERERARQERRREKERKRQQRRNQAPSRTPGQEGEDPDIAGIIPGPQPDIWEDELPDSAISDEPEHQDQDQNTGTHRAHDNRDTA